MPVAASAPPAAPADPTAGTPLVEPATAASPEAVRWGPFCCLLVAAAFTVYGTRFGSAVSWALGLAAVTAACRLPLPRRSAHDAARAAAPVHIASPARKTARKTARETARETDGAHRGGR
ncbi:hypothetical protein [Streptomyces finlayi]|uniref:hypothetical protein n=1 Tax=Streptomyces finlayi TaxID=67296 RepID=UPI001628F146|nr:hypothetical protein [Streptomyces finlayi]